jgi:hypothetical protein
MPEPTEDELSEPPYETIPSVPPNINRELFITTSAVVTNHDESVTSAHETHTGIYNMVGAVHRSKNISSEDINSLRKQLLMQDTAANETRL